MRSTASRFIQSRGLSGIAGEGADEQVLPKFRKSRYPKEVRAEFNYSLDHILCTYIKMMSRIDLGLWRPNDIWLKT